MNGNFDDCTKEILRDLHESSDSDEDDSYRFPNSSLQFISQQKIQNGTDQ